MNLWLSDVNASAKSRKGESTRLPSKFTMSRIHCHSAMPSRVPRCALNPYCPSGKNASMSSVMSDSMHAVIILVEWQSRQTGRYPQKSFAGPLPL